MILNVDETKNILNKVKICSKADSFETLLSGFNTNNLRFALNSVSTNGYSDGLSLKITSNFGNRSGTVILNNLNDVEIQKAVLSSEEIARLSPENKEFVSPLGTQFYRNANNFDKSIELLDFDKRASMISPFINNIQDDSLNSAGYWEDNTSFYAIMNSNGLYAYNKGTLASFSATLRTKEGNGSSRVQNQFIGLDKFDIKELYNKVVQKSLFSKNPVELKPGKYTVILEPTAAADMISYLLTFMDSREADEGRSYFSKNGSNEIGEKIVNDKINIYSDPVDTKCPGIPFSGDGYPLEKTIWFEKGVLKNLTRSRYWAKKTNQPVIQGYSNIIMDGTEKTTEELISNTEHGILITRFWYIRMVDPQAILLTGLTRDGLFEIKDGKLIHAIKNFRFNESPINMLNNVLEIGKAENAVGSETDTLQLFIPSLKVKGFNFSSLSDAI